MNEELESKNEPIEVNTARDELEQLLNEILPENERTGDVDEMALNYIRRQREMNSKMVEALSEDPRFAQAMAELISGERKAPAALARYFGRGFLETEEGSPDYEDIMSADSERNTEMENIRKATDEFNKNFDESMRRIEPFAQSNGMDADEFRIKIEDEILIPLLSGMWGEELLGKLKKALDYDKDVEDAFAAGEVQGRNTNINNLRVKASDGLPKGLSSQAPVVEKPRKRNRILESALGA